MACFDDDRTSTPPPPVATELFASIGIIHQAHNARPPNPGNISADPNRTSDFAAPSDADEWYDFPNFSGGDIRNISARAWGDRYYEWWFKHLPRYAGVFATATATQTPDGTATTEPTSTSESDRVPPGPYNNLWPYIAKPGCYNLPHSRVETTPRP